MPDKTSSELDRMVDDVVNRKRKPEKPASEAPRSHQDARNGENGTPTPPALEITGSVEITRTALMDFLTAVELALDTAFSTARTEISGARFAVDLLFQPLRQQPTVTPEAIADQRKKAEAEADLRAAQREQAKFEEKAREQAAAAQAATFDGMPLAVTGVRIAVEPNGWLCPDHGEAEFRTSPKGRQFRACPIKGCGEFERQR